MNTAATLPRPVEAFVQFAQLLRTRGFAIAPEQSMSFVEAIGVLGPRNIEDIRHAGLAILAIPPDRREEFDALFRAFFLDQTIAVPVSEQEEDEDTGVEAHEEQAGEQIIDLPEEEDEVGGEASASEALSYRELPSLTEDEALRHFTRQAGSALPRRRSYRMASARHGSGIDMRKAMRKAVQSDGELFALPELRRKTRQRPITLLIDVSGSMQRQYEDSLRIGHALMQVADRAEVFTLGTRLTRVSNALAEKNLDIALQRVSSLVADFDGGTRLGEALDALLSVPRFSAALRGAVVFILSDGLERGDPTLLIDSVSRISRSAWQLHWLTPLAGDDDFSPETEALKAVLPYLDGLGDGSSIAAITRQILASGKPERRMIA
ncbi:MAG: vWA domain-containing protein [Rhizobiaceae bacterium]